MLMREITVQHGIDLRVPRAPVRELLFDVSNIAIAGLSDLQVVQPESGHVSFDTIGFVLTCSPVCMLITVGGTSWYSNARARAPMGSGFANNK